MKTFTMTTTLDGLNKTSKPLAFRTLREAVSAALTAYQDDTKSRIRVVYSNVTKATDDTKAILTYTTPKGIRVVRTIEETED